MGFEEISNDFRKMVKKPSFLLVLLYPSDQLFNPKSDSDGRSCAWIYVGKVSVQAVAPKVDMARRSESVSDVFNVNCGQI